MGRIGILLIIVALIVGIIGCDGDGGNGESYTLTISSTDGGDSTCVPAVGCTCGEGTESSGGLNVPEECVCAEGTEVSIEGTPDPDYRFIGWTGDVDTVANINAATTTITMNGNYAITGRFEFVLGGTNYCDFYDFPDRFFEESSLTREQVTRVVSAQYLGLEKMHNCIVPYDFCRVEYDPEVYGCTMPDGFKLGDTAFPSLNNGHHRWEVMAHEQGHNFFGGASQFYYQMAAPYPFLQESLAVLSAFYTYHDISENAVAYGIDDDSISSLAFDFTNGRGYQEERYNQYISQGCNFGIEDVLTSQALDFKMITYGENYGWHNFEELAKAFEDELATEFDFLDDGASAIEQSTYIVAALNVAFERDFTEEFAELEFPIDDSLLQEFTTALEEYIH